MGRILFSTCGARGDLYPYLAIGQALTAAGHHVVVASDCQFEAEVTAAGLHFEPVRPQISPEAAAQSMDAARGTEFLFRKLLLPSLKDTIADLRPLARQADILVTHTTSLAGPIVAALEKGHGLKWLSGVVSPLALLSTHDSPALPVAPQLASANPLVNRSVVGLIRRQYGWFLKPVDDVRKEFGLIPGGNVLTEAAYSPLGTLLLFPLQLQPAQPDWPTQSKEIGFCIFQDHQPLSTEVLRFLQAGEPPLVFLPGSFNQCEATQWIDAGSRAAQQLGSRAIFAGVNSFQTSNVLGVPHLSLGSLLPHAKAMIHHGGIGTLALGLKFGLPMLLFPHSHDQPDTARMALRAGVAHQASRKHLNEQHLATLIRQLLEDQSLKANLERTRQHLANLPGAAGAATLIGGLIGS